MRASTGRCIGIAAAVACLVTAGPSGPARAVVADPGTHVTSLGDAGRLIGWGSAASLALPESLQGVAVASISMGSGWALAYTATGKIVTWGADGTIAPALPSSFAGLGQLSASGTNAAAAVTSDHRVIAWYGGNTSGVGAWLDTSALTDIATIAVGQQEPYGVALTRDGTVKTWGVDSGSGNVSSSVPGALTGVVSVAACDDTALAVTSDGGVHAWGSDTDGLVSNAPTNQVIKVACAGNTGVALRSDSSIVEWGDTAGVNAVPAALTDAVANGAGVGMISASRGGIVAYAGPGTVKDSNGNVIASSQGGLWAWGSPTLAAAPAPSLDAPAVSEYAAGSGGVYALVHAVFTVDKPVIRGTAVPGNTLGATDGTFSGNCDVTGQWYRDGTPIDGATTQEYLVSPSDVGKKLTYRDTAVSGYDPNDRAVAESDPLTVGPASTASTVTVTPHSGGGYGHASTVTVKVATPAGASGPVSLSVDGASAGTATLAHGSATFRLPPTLAAGIHMVGATYAGNSVSAGASGWATLTVAKATSHTKVRLHKRAHRGGKVKAVVTVDASGVRATGTVTVKIGQAKGYGSVIHGKAVVKLKVARSPHRQKVVAIYSGDNNVRGSRGHARL